MRQALEFHDSEVFSVVQEGSRIVIGMKVYLHLSDGEPGIDAGTGWTQLADLVLNGATMSNSCEAPFEIAQGSIVAGNRHFDNLVPLPFDGVEGVHFEISAFNGDHLSVDARSASIRLTGAPTYVEEVASRRR